MEMAEQNRGNWEQRREDRTRRVFEGRLSRFKEFRE